jgi:hypothetical protein
MPLRLDEIETATGADEELFDQRRLTDPRLTADEHCARSTRGHLLIDYQKFPHRLSAPCEDPKVEGCLGLRVWWSEPGHLPDEAVASTPLGFDELRAGAVVSERGSDSENVGLQDFRLDVDVWPQGRQQLIVGYQSASVFDQIAEDVESLGGEIEAFVRARAAIAPQAQIVQVDPKRRHLHHIGPPMG